MSDVDIEREQIIAGKYRLEAPLAQGGMGSVWRARHLALDTTLAIKFIGPNVTRQKEARRRFEREAKAAALLKSPHVVQIHDYGVEDELPYLVMELLEGEDLGERLKRRRRLAPVETVAIVTQVSRALRRAAEEGIVHRDLKPSNVFIARGDEEERVVVLDFGIAKAPRLRADDDRTHTGAVLGSPRYMSPEQARGTQLVDPRSDLWSLAVIAYRALTGQLPFQGTDVADLLVKICAEAAPAPSTIDASLGPDMDAFFARAFAKSPDDRFQTARELAFAFAVAAGEPAPPTSRVIDVSRLEERAREKTGGAGEKAEQSPASPASVRRADTAAVGARAPDHGGLAQTEGATRHDNGGARWGTAPAVELPTSAPRSAPRPPARPSRASLADCEPTLPSEVTADARATRRSMAELATLPEPTPPPLLPPPLLPPVPRRPFAESVTVSEPTPPPPVPKRARAESATVLEPTPPPPAERSPSDPSLTEESTTSLHVVSRPLSAPDRTLTPPGGSIDVGSRHEAPRRGIGFRLAIGAALLVSLGAALRVVLWARSDTTAAPALDGAAHAPPAPVTVVAPPAVPTVVAPDTTAAPSAVPPSPPTTTAPPRRGLAPVAPPARNRKSTILGI